MTSLVSEDQYTCIENICSGSYFKIPRYKKLIDFYYNSAVKQGQWDAAIGWLSEIIGERKIWILLLISSYLKCFA